LKKVSAFLPDLALEVLPQQFTERFRFTVRLRFYKAGNFRMGHSPSDSVEP
jgi:hypothetical protein